MHVYHLIRGLEETLSENKTIRHKRLVQNSITVIRKEKEYMSFPDK